MPLVDRIERKYGWIAIPGIVRILAGFQLLTFFLFHFNEELYNLMFLDPQGVMKGEVWRLVSFVLMPPTLKPLWLAFALYFMVFLGDILEQGWGSFRLTLYLIGGVLGVVLGTFFAFYVIGPAGYFDFMMRASSTGYIWVTSILFAVAVYHPSLQINLMGVIPIKVYWIALFDAGLILIDLFMLAQSHLLLPVSLLLAISNFLIVFGPSAVRQMRHRSEVAARRQKFESAKVPEDESLHRCATCGKTERDDPDLDFRVMADGEEYCEVHLPGKSTD